MKNPKIAFVLWLCLGLVGAHRAYLGHWFWFVVLIFTVGGLGLFWVIDGFRLGELVKLYNLEVTIETKETKAKAA